MVTAQQVKELRERTGAGILDAKKALEKANGDMDKAIEILKESGAAKAVKKAGRIAADGLVATREEGSKAIITEVNSETDFVAMNDQFKKLVGEIADTLVKNNFNSDEEAKNVNINGTTIEDYASKATATIGEKIAFRRATQVVKKEGQVFGLYTHVNGKIAAIVLLEGGNSDIAKNVAMHVAAMNPKFLDRDNVPANILNEYKKDIMEELSKLNKPENILEMMAEGKLKKALSEITLLDQPFAMESKQTVSQYLQSNNAKALKMLRFEVGEGIEKNQVDFATEVASQMK